MKSHRVFKNILVTGGCGFIGSNLIRTLFNKIGFEGNIINVDNLTYAGNQYSLVDIEKKYPTRYIFERTDICDKKSISDILSKYNIDAICHLAAESHVDRSIDGPGTFINTNIIGTFTLLECAKEFWEGNYKDKLFHHVSTDEVYGSLGQEGYFHETTAYDPRSPYSASKASSDHLVMSYFHTYGFPVTMTNCSNNYGPFQFPEKLIPLMIENMIEEKPLPIYGDGKNIRDWLYVEDHNTAVWEVMKSGTLGETYNIGGENEWQNIELVNRLCELVSEHNKKNKDYYKKLITYVNDRPGHDQRYAIDCSKLKKELGWTQSLSFDDGLQKTVAWYFNNRFWVENIKSGDYLSWIDKNYNKR